MLHRSALSIVAVAHLLVGAARAQCPDWSTELASANPDGYVYATATFDDGTGNALYAGGEFHHIGGIAANGVARWDGAQWTSVGSGIAGKVLCFCTFDSGTGPKLYAGGAEPGFPSHSFVRRLDGATWTLVADFNPDADDRSGVYSLAVFDDGSGPHLYAGGAFEGTVVRWDVPSWSIVAGGFENDGLLDEPYVRALCVHDDGQGGGATLYAGGSLRFTGNPWGTVSTNIARLENGVWSSVGSGLGNLYTQDVEALLVHDDGSGPSLYAAGTFAGGVKRWNGTAFVALGTGLSGNAARAQALGSIVDASGPKLVAGGWFSTAGGQPAANVAAWDGASWSAIGSGISGIPSTPLFGTLVYAFTTFDQGTGRGPDLVVGGAFTMAGGNASSGLALLASCGGTATGFCFGDGSATACPCGNASAIGAQAGCLSSLGVGATLRVHGRAQISDDTLVLEGASMPNSPALYYQGASLLNGGAGAVFGDGIHCAGGPFVRLGTKTNVNGASQYPSASDPLLSVRGHVTTAGTRYYQARYRNAAAFCTSDTFNYTSGVGVIWAP